MVDPQEVGAWFAGWLVTATVPDPIPAGWVNKLVGFSDVPTQDPNPAEPYSVVYLLPSPKPEGAWSHPDNEQELVFQITSVGRSPEQAGWMQTAVRTAVLGRDAAGRYIKEMAPIAFTVWGRISDGVGGIVKSGDRLFTAADTYRLKVSP